MASLSKELKSRAASASKAVSARQEALSSSTKWGNRWTRLSNRANSPALVSKAFLALEPDHNQVVTRRLLYGMPTLSDQPPDQC